MSPSSSTSSTPTAGAPSSLLRLLALCAFYVPIHHKLRLPRITFFSYKALRIFPAYTLINAGECAYKLTSFLDVLFLDWL